MLPLVTGLATPPALADPIYTISDLGTLNGQSSSVATAINNQGQVVGISYNSSDGSFVYNFTDSTTPPRFVSNGNGATSFLYNSGQVTQINPTGGLAMSINISGQVVGGTYTSINDSGQYVGGADAGVRNQSGTYSGNYQIVNGGSATSLQLTPYAINNEGRVAGAIVTHESPAGDYHAAVYQNGQITDLSSQVPNAQHNSQAIAINQQGDILITVGQAYQTARILPVPSRHRQSHQFVRSFWRFRVDRLRPQ